MKIVVLGAGSWGTALAIVLGRNGHDVTLACRNEEELAFLNSHHENMRYMPGFAIPASVSYCDFSGIPIESDFTVVAVPSPAVRGCLRDLSHRPSLIVSAAKGLEPTTGAHMTTVINETIPSATVAALSGPNLAIEIVRSVPSAAVVASSDAAAADLVRTAFMNARFRIYASDDVVGVELAGALKNVLALGAGMSDGLGFGDNTKAALMARGLKEMIALGLKMGARLETFLGIAGVGDLFATAASSLSRNYRLGRALAEGSTMAEALTTLGQVAEGAKTAEAAAILALRHDVELPIMLMIEGVVRGRISAKEAVVRLMERDTREEGVCVSQ